MLTTRAAVVEAPGAPFQVQDVTLDGPRPGEVLVEMVAAGLCHTDLGAQLGGIPFPLPGILGHEGAGVVREVGEGVTRVEPGDHVLLSYISCGRCGNCRGGHPAYCVTWVPDNLLMGVRADGSRTVHRDGTPIGGRFFGQSSFSAHALADERAVVKVDADAPLELLAALVCGAQTGFGTVWNVLAPRPGATLAIFGTGAVGLSALLAARQLPLAMIVAVDRVPERLQLARELGATHTVDTRRDNAAEVLAELTGGRGLDHAVDTTAVPALVRTAVDALGVGGRCAVVGAPPAGTEVSLDVQGLLPGKQVVGVTLGDGDPETLLPQLVALYQQGELPLERFVKHYPLAELNAAAADMHEGRTIKPVITFTN
ncbi:NAD(P)-dependent alcohol dehydrogenase [Nitriliruptor alkaliphilus]|uniref:NAD(P)-dependent alcohol dehydrogenase n=1 Tax=Nitriliruptor alkaliphilus TaxID=427918 RepID=UPI000698EA07|nr:NAD(P)-dependent alcohol dehydrogenase [Nitriliruptor alkaliphilus]